MADVPVRFSSGRRAPFLLISKHQVLISEAKPPWTPAQRPRTCSRQRCFGAGKGRTAPPLPLPSGARRGGKNKRGPRSQKPTFTPLSHAGPLPHKPAAYRRSLDCGQPPGAASPTSLDGRGAPAGAASGPESAGEARGGSGAELPAPARRGKGVEGEAGGGEEAGAALPWGRRWLRAAGAAPAGPRP